MKGGWLVDVAAAFWLAVSILLRIGIVVIFISAIDDFIIDCWYWFWRLRHPRSWRATDALPRFADALYLDEQKPIAIMLPAWHESDVIERMADYTAGTLDYQNYQLFIGTYPNDAQTQAAVDRAAARHPHVHKVVTGKPGPTTKADCLNHVIDAIEAFEVARGVRFNCITYHDAEDVVHPLELRLFNHLVPAYDMVQLPVFPLVRSWPHVVGNHYIDEFAEGHGKDLLVREQMCGQVPSAGVGTAFSRHALDLLKKINGDQRFNTHMLTEDYEVGMRLHQNGARELLVHYPVRFEGAPPPWAGRAGVHDMVCVQEYFPDSTMRAARQKSRWMVGIVYQGWRNLGWLGGAAMRYMLMRDRKGVLAFPSLLLAYIIASVVLLNAIHLRFSPNSWRFPDLIPRDSVFWAIAGINFIFMLNRLLQRFICTRRYYGLWHGLQSAPRMLFANLINIAAFWRALTHLRESRRSGRPVKWEKTHHVFPDLQTGAPGR